MVKTNKNSRFELYTLSDIRKAECVILQIEDTGSKFATGDKCYLCEVVNSVLYYNTRNESDLIKEICELNREKRRLEKKIVRLENKISRLNDERGESFEQRTKADEG